MNAPNEDEKRRDEVLKRMLATPPKPHDDGKGKPQKTHKAEPKPKDSPDGKD
jgi:hypothetical protein